MRGGPVMLAGGGIGTLVIVLLVALLGGDPGAVLNQLPQGGSSVNAPSEGTVPPGNDEASQFISSVLASTEDVWKQLFRQQGQTYRPPNTTALASLKFLTPPVR